MNSALETMHKNLIFLAYLFLDKKFLHSLAMIALKLNDLRSKSLILNNRPITTEILRSSKLAMVRRGISITNLLKCLQKPFMVVILGQALDRS